VGHFRSSGCHGGCDGFTAVRRQHGEILDSGIPCFHHWKCGDHDLLYPLQVGLLLLFQRSITDGLAVSIAIFRSTPVSMAGTVGAIFNGGLELGMAIGYAACESVQVAVDATEARKAHEQGRDVDSYTGRRAAFQLMLGLAALQVSVVTIFMKTVKSTEPASTTSEGTSKHVETTDEKDVQ
jgi:hypothetical protein